MNKNLHQDKHRADANIRISSFLVDFIIKIYYNITNNKKGDSCARRI